MSTTIDSTIADLYKVKQKAEIVNGEIVLMSPTGGEPGYAATQIVVSLGIYARQCGRGYAIGDNVGFIVDLPNRRSFSPDAAYYFGPLTMKFIEGAPALAVEVRSEGDYGPAAERAIEAKRADYFAAGTQVVWDVDLLSEEVVRVYRPGAETPTAFRRGELADAEPTLPGWKMPVADLFPPASESQT